MDDECRFPAFSCLGRRSVLPTAPICDGLPTCSWGGLYGHVSVSMSVRGGQKEREKKRRISTAANPHVVAISMSKCTYAVPLITYN